MPSDLTYWAVTGPGGLIDTLTVRDSKKWSQYAAVSKSETSEEYDEKWKRLAALGYRVVTVEVREVKNG